LENDSSTIIGKTGDDYFYYSISPDQTRFFAKSSHEEQGIYSDLNILSSSNGDLKNYVELSPEIFKWLDNNNVYIIEYDKEIYPSFLISYNLDSTDSIRLPLNFINKTIDQRWYQWVIQPNNSLDYLVFPNLYQLDSGDKGDLIDGFSLLDIQNSKIVNSIRSAKAFDSLSEPVWSSDGSRFYVATSIDGKLNHDEIYSMDTKGAINRLTFFTENHTFVDISSVILSPKGDKLAFWVGLDSNKPLETYLAVLDLINKYTVKYCLQENIDSFGTTCYYGEPPLWSPDNSFIALTNCTEPNNSEGIHTKIVIVDLINNTYKLFSENQIVKGWIINSP
jgi:hypothetical protein